MTIPTNGLVFYAPLAENADCAYTLTNSGSVTFQTFGGRQCAYFDGSSALYNNSFQVADAFTFSFNAYFQSGDCLFALGPWTKSHNMEVMTNNGYPRLYTYKNGSDENLIDATTNIKDGWHHIACTYDGTTQKLYVDGNLSASRTFSATIGAGIALGTNFTSSGAIGRETKMPGYLAACRVYNRALSDSEITELSKEFSTTGGSLDTVLSALDGARDALVTAINAKGGSLADNATLHQCADAVGSLSGGTSAEYYKCASVDTGGTVTDGKTIVVVDPVWKIWSGTYTLVDESATGDARVWKDAATGAVLKKYDYDGFRWGFWENDTINYAWCTQVGVHENPWDATLYINDESGEEFDFTLTPSTTTVPGNTWSGYKAVFDSTAGTWSFESGVTSGLTYTSVTPIVGGIYSADALVIVSLLYDKICNRCTAYYRLDGNCRDSVNIHDGIPNKITFVDGKIGRCAHTNGSSQYISLPNEVSVKGRTQVSYSGWCFIESTPNKDFYIVTEIANSSGYTRASFGVNTSLLPFAIARTVATGDTGSVQKVTGTSPMSTGTWYFLCAVFDLSNGNIILYVNGVSVGSLDVTASSFVDANRNRIRLFEFDESGSGNVRADEVGIWSKALSAAEVSELYNHGAGKPL